jgi:hypothetical protein
MDPGNREEIARMLARPVDDPMTLGGETSVVDLPCRIDVQACSWQVRNGVLDISCRKA